MADEHGFTEEQRQVVLTACQLLGKVNYFWGGKSGFTTAGRPNDYN